MKNNLWNAIENIDAYAQNNELYQQHILEQYKIYIEMADRISARRNLANVFFLTLHTTLLSIIGFSVQNLHFVCSKWLLILPFTGIIIMCGVWWWLLQSFRQLNTAKYRVIGLLEEKLPSSPYWLAEWKELGEGKNWKKYLPLTSLEKLVPVIFSILYFIILYVVLWM